MIPLQNTQFSGTGAVGDIFDMDFVLWIDGRMRLSIVLHFNRALLKPAQSCSECPGQLGLFLSTVQKVADDSRIGGPIKGREIRCAHH